MTDTILQLQFPNYGFGSDPLSAAEAERIRRTLTNDSGTQWITVPIGGYQAHVRVPSLAGFGINPNTEGITAPVAPQDGDTWQLAYGSGDQASPPMSKDDAEDTLRWILSVDPDRTVFLETRWPDGRPWFLNIHNIGAVHIRPVTT